MTAYTIENLLAGLKTFTKPGTARYEDAVKSYRDELAAQAKPDQRAAIRHSLEKAMKGLTYKDAKLEVALRAAGINPTPTVTQKVASSARSVTATVTEKAQSFGKNRTTKTTKTASTRTTVMSTTLASIWRVLGALVGLVVGALFAMLVVSSWIPENSDNAPAFLVGLLGLVIAIAILLLGMTIGYLIAHVLVSRSRVTKTEAETEAETTSIEEILKDHDMPVTTTA